MSLKEEDRKTLVKLYWSKVEQTIEEAHIAMSGESCSTGPCLSRARTFVFSISLFA